MDEMEAAVLAAAEQIIDNEYHSNEAIATLQGMFHLGRRQAEMALYQIRSNFTLCARRAGMLYDDYIDAMTTDHKMAVFGFCVGAVQQRDKDRALNPEDGTPLPRPATDYEI